MNLSVTVDGKTFSVEIANPKADPMVITVDGTEFTVSADASGAVSAAPAQSFVEGSETVINTALDYTFGGTWYVLLGSSIAFLVSALVIHSRSFALVMPT